MSPSISNEEEDQGAVVARRVGGQAAAMAMRWEEEEGEGEQGRRSCWAALSCCCSSPLKPWSPRADDSGGCAAALAGDSGRGARVASLPASGALLRRSPTAPAPPPPPPLLPLSLLLLLRALCWLLFVVVSWRRAREGRGAKERGQFVSRTRARAARSEHRAVQQWISVGVRRVHPFTPPT